MLNRRAEQLPFIFKAVNLAPRAWKIIRYGSLGVWLWLLPPGAFAQSADVPNSIEAAKKTVAPIVCMVRDAATGAQMIRFRIVGTAFMVDPVGMFVTANHVITDLMSSPDKEVCRAAITFPVGGWMRDPQANVEWFSFDPAGCRVNGAYDVAVCRTNSNLATEARISFDVVAVSTQKPRDGTTIFFTGFPLQATDPITSVGSVAGYPAGDSYSTIIIDKNTWPGASGSPIYLSDGKTLVGMITKTGTGEAAGLSFGTVSEKIAAILADARSNWGEKKAGPAPAQH